MLDAATEYAGATGHEMSATLCRKTGWRGWRGLGRVAAGLLALVALAGPGRAEAAEAGEWPTTPDNGPGQVRRCTRGHGHGAGGMAVLAVMPEEALAAGEVVYVASRPEPTRRQKRLLRRAERHAKKAEKLRAKSGVDDREVLVVRPALRVPARYAVVGGGGVVPVRAERKAEQARRRGEAVQRAVDRALRDGVIDGEERRRIGEAARAAARER